jgi:hypothetical protein
MVVSLLFLLHAATANDTADVTLLTDENRHYTGSAPMMGGWGEHLRAPMQASDGTVWIVIDSGPSVYQNTALKHFSRSPGQGSWVLSQNNTGVIEPAGVQQNMASVMLNDVIYSYGVNPQTATVQECEFSARAQPAFGFRCSAVCPVSPNSNYIAAAVQGNTKLVMWTTVGAHGGPGTFNYAANYGNGWNYGPAFSFNVSLFNDVSYVRAAFVPGASSRVVLLAQGSTGKYAPGDNSQFATVAMELDLGYTSLQDVHVFYAPQKGSTKVGTSPEDLFVDAKGGMHAVVREDGGSNVLYFFRPPNGAAWGTAPAHSFASAYRARFFETNSGACLHLALGSTATTLQVFSVSLTASAGKAIEWADAAHADVSGEGANANALVGVGAIYVPRAAYGGSGTTTILAAGGSGSDGDVWAAELPVALCSTAINPCSSWACLRAGIAQQPYSNTTFTLPTDFDCNFDGEIKITSHVLMLGHKSVCDAFHRGRFFRVSAGASLELDSMILKNGFDRTEGGAILSAGDIRITNSTLTTNQALYGASLYLYGKTTVTIKGTTFYAGNATQGGAIYGASQIAVTDSNFTSCFASHEGGAIVFTGTHLNISSSMFNGNRARHLGGAVCSFGLSLHVVDSTFRNNYAAIPTTRYQNGGNPRSITFKIPLLICPSSSRGRNLFWDELCR